MLLQATPGTRFVAGGTDLTIQLGKMDREPSRLVALNHVTEMNRICLEKDSVWIGGNATFADLSSHTAVRKHVRALSVAASKVGSPQIRNRATLAGNIANASPCADSIAPLLIYDASVQVLNGQGFVRNLDVLDVVVGPDSNSLSYNEVIYGLKIPLKPQRFRSHFVKLGAKKSVTVAKIGMALGFERDAESGTVRNPKIALSAVGKTARRFDRIESLLEHRSLDSRLLTDFAEALSQEIELSIKERPSMPYKREAVKGLAMDILSYWTDLQSEERGYPGFQVSP